MPVEFGTIANFGLAALLINGVLMWIREWRKHRTWSQNGNELSLKVDEIKTTTLLFTHSLERMNEHLGEMNVTMAEVKTSVTGQQKTCSTTVKRFDKAFSDQNKELISLAKESGRKR